MGWINVKIPDSLHKRLKAKAIAEDNSIKVALEKAIERYVDGHCT